MMSYYKAACCLEVGMILILEIAAGVVLGIFVFLWLDSSSSDNDPPP
jgi:hypothetical protein